MLNFLKRAKTPKSAPAGASLGLQLHTANLLHGAQFHAMHLRANHHHHASRSHACSARQGCKGDHGGGERRAKAEMIWCSFLGRRAVDATVSRPAAGILPAAIRTPCRHSGPVARIQHPSVGTLKIVNRCRADGMIRCMIGMMAETSHIMFEHTSLKD